MDGERLAELREDRNLTQEELAQIVGLSRNSISLYETGEKAPNAKVLKKFCEFFDISADYLLGLTELEISYRREMHIPLPKDCPADLQSHIKSRMEELVEFELYKRKKQSKLL